MPSMASAACRDTGRTITKKHMIMSRRGAAPERHPEGISRRSQAASSNIMGGTSPGRPLHRRRSLWLGASVELMARELEKLDLSFIDWPRLQRAAARSELRMSRSSRLRKRTRWLSNLIARIRMGARPLASL